MDDLVDVITDQNFVPVIDDQEKFIGIVITKLFLRRISTFRLTGIVSPSVKRIMPLVSVLLCMVCSTF